MYDWANSVYALVIVSAIFPAYYNIVTRESGLEKISFLNLEVSNTALYSICLGISFGIVAVVSPLLSSISDHAGNHLAFMRFFCYLGATSCAALFLFEGRNILLGLIALMLATIGYGGSIVFYNAYLPAIATMAQQDKVSAKGFAFGYLGASSLLIINLIAILNQQNIGIQDDTLLPRFSFLLTGCWWFGFAHITFAKLPRGIYAEKTGGHHFLNGYRELIKVWNNLKSLNNLRKYLLAFFFYIMGVQTVMFMAASFGEKEIHLGLIELIITVLALEYVGIGGAFLFARLSKQFGNINALVIAVLTWICICIGAYFMHTAIHFYTTAVFIGLVMGGIQALSRSTYSKLIPKTENNAGYFSFYDVCEKVAMMCGLVMFGYLDNLTGSMRNSIVALLIWFILGLIFLLRTRPIEMNYK